jgi:hypothetical protein
VSPPKQKQKREIAQWFQIWLEAPEIFEAWLALRKKSSDYEAILISQD